MWNTSFTKSKDEALPPKDTNNWQEAARKKLMQTGNAEQADRYANHVTKAAMNRRLKKNELLEKKGPLFDG